LRITLPPFVLLKQTKNLATPAAQGPGKTTQSVVARLRLFSPPDNIELERPAMHFAHGPAAWHGAGAAGNPARAGLIVPYEAAPMKPEQTITTLKALAAAEAACTRCPLYRNATQAVPGEGAVGATLMLVGEQPGDQEDLQGHPFVGPAGRMLDRALADAEIDRRQVFVTNAVKHFKFEPRGKRRLHKKPNASEIDRCHWWLDLEKKIVHPRLFVALGATAARSLYGRPVTIGKVRGEMVPLADGGRMLVTIHPSYLLRIEDEDDRAAQYAAFVRDLRTCRKVLTEGA
jgi:DNA polymerase